MDAVQIANEALSRATTKELAAYLRENSDAINADFASALIGEAQHASKQHAFPRAIQALRALWSAGDIKGSALWKATAQARISLVYFEQGKLQESVDSLKRSIELCVDQSQIELRSLAAECTYHLGRVQGLALGQVGEGLRNLERARILFDELLDPVHSKEAAIEVDRIRTLESAGRLPVPFHDLAAKMVEGQDKLDRLSHELRQAETALKVIIQSVGDAKQINTQVGVKRQSLEQAISELNDKHAGLSAKIEPLEARIRLLRASARIPLWAAVIRADLDEGRISVEGQRLLDRIGAISPEVATAFKAEIAARLDRTPRQPFDLSGLSGPARLFAAISNAALIDLDPARDPTASAEVLADAWESYLKWKTV